jgi:hypothetical protein
MSIQFCDNCNKHIDTDTEAEHFGDNIKCEVCGQNIRTCMISDNKNRCQDCFEEFGNNWPDKL